MSRRPALRGRLDYAGCALDALCDDAADLAWLREFLCPWFEPRPAQGAADASVALRRDAAELDAARAAGPLPAAAPRPAFLADGVAQTLVAWAGHGALLRFHDPGADAFVEAREPGVWRVLAAPGAHFARVAWMRVLRELATLHVARRGAALLHAAAIEQGGAALAFVGPKRSGKTSCLLFALGAPGARFVANDRVCAWDGRPVQVRGMPTIVNLRADALAAFPALAQRVREADPRVASRSDESRVGQPEWPRRAGSVGLGSAAFLAASGAAACAQAPLAAIAFPRVSGRPGGFACTRLPTDEALRRLRAADLLSGAPRGGPFEPPVGLRGGAPSADAWLPHLAERVPCVECRLDLDALSGDPAVFLDAIRAAALATL